MKITAILPVLIGLALVPGLYTSGQVVISNSGVLPEASAGLEVRFSDKGFLPPRLTMAQRDSIQSPATGLVIYLLECSSLQVFNGSGWVPLGNAGTLAAPGPVTGDTVVCAGASGLQFAVPSVPGATGYNWSVPPGAVISAGQGTSSITLAMGQGGGPLCVFAFNGCSTGPVSCKTLTLMPPPAAPLPGTNTASQSVVTWNWQPVQDADGYKWNTTDNPATATDLGNTTSYVENGLLCNVLYNRYVWSYEDCAVSPSTMLMQKTAECPATCPGIPSVMYEGQTYPTVQIGSQCWLGANLNVGARIDGIVAQTNNGFPEKYCYNDLESNCTIYGGLYQWNELMQYTTTAGATGLCPPGWHIPAGSEWSVLTGYLGGDGIAGGALKEAGTLHWLWPNSGATNSSGFTGLPGGKCIYDGTFSHINRFGNFWTSSQYDSGNAWYRDMDYGYEGVNSYTYEKVTAFSVRCIKD